MADTPDLVLARPTITLPADGRGRLVPGRLYWVDRGSPWVARAIARGVLIVEASEEPEPDPQEEAQ